MRPGRRSVGRLRPLGRGRRRFSRGSPPRTPRTRRMLNRKGDPDVRPIQIIRIDPVRTRRRRAPPSSTFTQAMATGPVSSPTSWDPKDGSTASCRPKSPTSRTIRSAACGRLRRSRAERTSKPTGATAAQPLGYANYESAMRSRAPLHLPLGSRSTKEDGAGTNRLWPIVPEFPEFAYGVRPSPEAAGCLTSRLETRVNRACGRNGDGSV